MIHLVDRKTAVSRPRQVKYVQIVSFLSTYLSGRLQTLAQNREHHRIQSNIQRIGREMGNAAVGIDRKEWKKMASNLWEGLFTFSEDIRRATVGDEGVWIEEENR